VPEPVAEVTPADLARILRAAADEADRIAAEHRAERRDWIDQVMSPLGRRRHVAAVRRRVGAGAAGAALVGRRALLSSEALAEELAALSTRKRPARPETGAQRMLRRLGLLER
jgi:hypothetical protein